MVEGRTEGKQLSLFTPQFRVEYHQGNQTISHLRVTDSAQPGILARDLVCSATALLGTQIAKERKTQKGSSKREPGRESGQGNKITHAICPGTWEKQARAAGWHRGVGFTEVKMSLKLFKK